MQLGKPARCVARASSDPDTAAAIRRLRRLCRRPAVPRAVRRRPGRRSGAARARLVDALVSTPGVVRRRRRRRSAGRPGDEPDGAHNAGRFDATATQFKAARGRHCPAPDGPADGAAELSTRVARDAESDHCGARRTKRAEGRALSVRPSRLIAFPRPPSF